MKSKKSIFDAFINLRSKKELRKITVKELCEKALINKSTFYTYYEDMFDLSDKIESEVVDGIVSTISNPQMMIDEPRKILSQSSGCNDRKQGTDKHGFFRFTTSQSYSKAFKIIEKYDFRELPGIYKR